VGNSGQDVPIQDGDQWRDLVKTAMNLRVPLNMGYFLTQSLSASQRELCSMDLVS